MKEAEEKMMAEVTLEMSILGKTKCERSHKSPYSSDKVLSHVGMGFQF